MSVARCLLAEHLVRHAQPQRALDVIAPSLVVEPKGEWLLRSVEARALHLMERSAEARSAALRALETAPSEQKRIDLRDRFAESGLFGGQDAE